MIDQAVKEAQRELKDTKLYLRQKNMKIIRGNRDDTFTEYVFFYGGYEEHRRYLNVRLRNRVEELLGVYLVKMKQVNWEGGRLFLSISAAEMQALFFRRSLEIANHFPTKII